MLLLTCVFTTGLAVSGTTAKAESANKLPGKLRTLTKAREVHSLSSAEAARAYPVHLRGVVTYYYPETSTKLTGVFVHDTTGSIYVGFGKSVEESLPPGTLVDVRGESNPGEFAPTVAHPQIKVIGFSGLPATTNRPSFSRLSSGVEDGQWVEVEGVVRSVIEEGLHVSVQVEMEGGNISAFMVKETGVNYAGLVDARVRVRGNARPLFDITRRHMIGARLECPNLSAVDILEPAPQDPFKLPVIPIDRLLQWDVAPLLAHRVHVQGRVTLLWPGSSVCLRDATRGICAQTDQGTHLVDGELVDVAGFARANGNAPVLTDAVFRSAGGAGAVPVAAEPVTAEQVLLGRHESQLIQIDGQLISRDLALADTTLLLTSGKFIFTAILPHGLGGPETGTWKNGSILRITGICSVQIDAKIRASEPGTAVPRTFRVLMRSPADVTVVKKASWWTPGHMVVLLAVALAGTLAVLGWVVVLRKRIRESEERFRHMAQHDSLTGLATRLVLQDRLSMAMESAKRHRRGLAVLMLDLDKFKEINDKFGHLAGDEVLKVTANRLLESVRDSDTVARIGGDEFVILLPEFDSVPAVENIAGNLVATLSAPVQFEQSEMPISVSIGVCVFRADEFDPQQVLKDADTAMYLAKERGRSCFVVFNRKTTPVSSETAH
jgi:diguanylate cyclase (GGDEF)-like protein